TFESRSQRIEPPRAFALNFTFSRSDIRIGGGANRTAACHYRGAVEEGRDGWQRRNLRVGLTGLRGRFYGCPTKSAVLNSLSSTDAQRGYRHAMEEFIEWYCSEPRLSFSKPVVIRYRIHLESPFGAGDDQSPARGSPP